MKSLCRQFDRDEGGAALILSLLVILALTSVGIVSMQRTTESMRQSGNYRVRTQAQSTSDATARFLSKRAGDKASAYWRMMQARGDFEYGQASGAGRDAAVRRGGYVMLDKEDYEEALLGGTSDPANSGETGLFTNSDATVQSFERAFDSQDFSVVIRDPIEGPPATGYSEDYCFKKVLIAGQARYQKGDSWDEPSTTSGVGRTAVEGFIGPVECGAR